MQNADDEQRHERGPEPERGEATAEIDHQGRDVGARGQCDPHGFPAQVLRDDGALAKLAAGEHRDRHEGCGPQGAGVDEEREAYRGCGDDAPECRANDPAEQESTLVEASGPSADLGRDHANQQAEARHREHRRSKAADSS